MPDKTYTEVIKLLRTGHLEQALAMCHEALVVDAKDVNILAILGLIQLKTGRFNEAEAAFSKAITLEPRFVKPHEDLATLYMQQQQPAKAEPLFRRVSELEPQSQSAWFGLAHALKAQGKTKEANHAALRAEQLSPLKPVLDNAQQHCNQGNFKQAQALCRQALAQQPDYIPALRQLAIIEAQQGNTLATEQLLQKIVELAPRDPKPAAELSRFYSEQQRYIESIELLKRSISLDPSNPGTHLELAETLSILGLPEQALPVFDKARELAPSSAIGRIGRANALRALGRSDEAIKAYQQCLTDNIKASEAWWSLSSLRTYTFNETELQSMRSLLASPASSDSDKTYLNFAIGKALDDHHQYDQAWSCYAQGNAYKRRSTYYDAVATETEFDAIIEASEHLLKQLRQETPAGNPSDVTPIFILGMPRSGSTLLEQILVSHSQVESTSELPYMLGLGKPLLSKTNTNEPSISTLTDEQLLNMRELYLRETQRHRTQGSSYFIDKMPDNFQMIGLISRILPQAKIIDARRHPLDTCVSNYRQCYAQGKNFSYELFELGEYYLQYLRLMRHWDEQCPGKVLRVQYEDLVENTEQEITRILSFCGLPWEEACLNFHQTQRAITSASSEQVRQPIYTTAIGFWKNYEPDIGELIEVLQAELDLPE